MKFLNQNTFPVILKILVLTGLMIVVFGLIHCSDLITEPKAPGNQPEYTGISANNQPSLIATTPGCEDGVQPGGALYRICMPAEWNGDLVIYAHGYVSPFEPLAIQDNEVNGVPVSTIINGLNYAFATSSYRENGLVVPEAVQDLVELAGIFRSKHGEPSHVYLVGVSEGGLVTTLALENHPDVFDGGLAGCGPVGDLQKQLNYFGDFRVLFDYFFPGVIPKWTEANPDIPPDVIATWLTIYEPKVKTAVLAHPVKTAKLLRVSRAAIDASDPVSLAEKICGVLRYNIFAYNNAKLKLGGQPFDNSKKFYFGSGRDFRLNRRIERFHADPAAIASVKTRYQTSGLLPAPLVTIHTLNDEIVPYWHEPLYTLKVLGSGSMLQRFNIPINRYGHCNFEANEVLAAFAILVLKVSLRDLLLVENALPPAASVGEIQRLVREYKTRPNIAAR